MLDRIKLFPGNAMRSAVGQAQNIQHVIFARCLVLSPKCSLERTSGKKRTVAGDMAQDDAFAFSGEQHVMFTDDIATANGAEADVAPCAGTGQAITPPVRNVAKIDAAPFGSRFAQHQGSARGRVHLLVVVIFDYLDVVIGIQRRRDLAGQHGQQVDPETHVACTHHNGMAGRSLDLGQVIVRQSGGADHMYGARLCRQFGKGHGRSRGGKIDHRLRAGKAIQRIIGHDHTVGRATHRGADILAHPVMAVALDRTGKIHPWVFGNLGHQHLPHPPGHSGDDDPDLFAHDFLHPWIFACIAAGHWLGKARQTAYVPDMAKNRSQSFDGPSQRQLRVGELVRRTLSDVLARGDVHDPDLNRYSITVGEVRVSPDLRMATAFVVPLGGKGQEDVLDLLNRNRGELRRLVAKNMTLKFSPDLRFKLDDTFDRMDDTRRMFEQDDVRRDIED